MRVTTIDVAENKSPTVAALRQRRLRERWAQGIIRAEVFLAPSAVEALVSCGWLEAGKRDQRQAIEGAFIRFSERAISLRVTPPAE